MRTRPSSRITTPLPVRSVPSIDAVNASSGTSARSPTTLSSADLRSNATSPCVGCNAGGNAQRVRSVTNWPFGAIARQRRHALARDQCYRTPGGCGRRRDDLTTLRITGRVGFRRATSTKPARSNIVFAPNHMKSSTRAVWLVARIRFEQRRTLLPRPRERALQHRLGHAAVARLRVDEKADDRPHRLLVDRLHHRRARELRVVVARAERHPADRAAAFVTEKAGHDAAIDQRLQRALVATRNR